MEGRYDEKLYTRATEHHIWQIYSGYCVPGTVLSHADKITHVRLKTSSNLSTIVYSCFIGEQTEERLSNLPKVMASKKQAKDSNPGTMEPKPVLLTSVDPPKI